MGRPRLGTSCADSQPTSSAATGVPQDATFHGKRRHAHPGVGPHQERRTLARWEASQTGGHACWRDMSGWVGERRSTNDEGPFSTIRPIY
jgi:hypothetical protein